MHSICNKPSTNSAGNKTVHEKPEDICPHYRTFNLKKKSVAVHLNHRHNLNGTTTTTTSLIPTF
jgi:hypothetical protein